MSHCQFSYHSSTAQADNIQTGVEKQVVRCFKADWLLSKQVLCVMVILTSICEVVQNIFQMQFVINFVMFQSMVCLNQSILARSEKQNM